MKNLPPWIKKNRKTELSALLTNTLCSEKTF